MAYLLPHHSYDLSYADTPDCQNFLQSACSQWPIYGPASVSQEATKWCFGSGLLFRPSLLPEMQPSSKSFHRSSKVLPTFPLRAEKIIPLRRTETLGRWKLACLKALWASVSSDSLGFLSISLGDSQFLASSPFLFHVLTLGHPQELHPRTPSLWGPEWFSLSHALNAICMLMILIFPSPLRRTHLSRCFSDSSASIVIKIIGSHGFAHLSPFATSPLMILLSTWLSR